MSGGDTQAQWAQRPADAGPLMDWGANRESLRTAGPAEPITEIVDLAHGYASVLITLQKSQKIGQHLDLVSGSLSLFLVSWFLDLLVS